MCTSFQLKAQDGSVVVGRTMEFPNLMGATITVLPRGTQGESVAPTGAGKTWTSTYGVVGMDAFGMPTAMTDGMNEAGVYAALLYMPNAADYVAAANLDASRAMSIVHTVAYVLGTCANVAEAKAAMAAVDVWGFVLPQMGFAPPAHLVVHDKEGACLVVEWRDGQAVVFDNPIGVVTNTPHLDWHLTNLQQYLRFSPQNAAPVTINGVTLVPNGQGSGMVGLPADITPPSRFVRAAAYVATLLPVADAPALEMSALHVLNNFDIPFGLVRAGDAPSNDDHTLWSTISNLADKRYVVRSVDNPLPQAIDLTKTDFTAGPPRQTPLPQGGFATLTV